MTSDQAILPKSFNTSTEQASKYILLFCIDDQSSLCLSVVYAVLNVLLLPLYVTVLLVGFQQWLQQRGALSAIATSDILINNLALIELVGALSGIIFTAGSFNKSMSVLSASFCLFAMYFCGEALFHCAICVDRYLAIVHPITYRHLKEYRAVLVRNVAIVVCWIIFFFWIPHTLEVFPDFAAKSLLAFIITFTLIVFYCCFAALYVLTRPGPNGKKQVDKSKLKAFQIISIITCLLFLKMMGILIYLSFYISQPLDSHQLCMTLFASVIVIIPANALIPVLYLRRMKQTCC